MKIYEYLQKKVIPDKFLPNLIILVIGVAAFVFSVNDEKEIFPLKKICFYPIIL